MRPLQSSGFFMLSAYPISHTFVHKIKIHLYILKYKYCNLKFTYPESI